MEASSETVCVDSEEQQFQNSTEENDLKLQLENMTVDGKLTPCRAMFESTISDLYRVVWLARNYNVINGHTQDFPDNQETTVVKLKSGDSGMKTG